MLSAAHDRMPSWAPPGGARDWHSINRQRERMERARAEAKDRFGHALRDVEAIQRAKAVQPVEAHMPDADIRQLAERRARVMGDRIDALSAPTSHALLLGWLNAQVHALDARRDAFAFAGDAPEDEQLRSFLARARCPLWWRRQLRARVVRLREDAGRQSGEVCARRQLYVTDDTLRRRAAQLKRNADMLAATEVEADDGELLRLSVAAGASTSNRAIRRGELMTRIRGCEEWAEARGMAGLFTTNTAPSRFHAIRHEKHGGGRNHRHFGDESAPGVGNYGPVQPHAPRDAQAWLRGVWAKSRAALARLGVPFFGFRVAEPHHDGCPHWHMLLWTAPEHVDKLRDVLRAQWLADHPDEDGADKHRFKAVTMEKGGAAGYIAKYIAKNIDDDGCVIDGQLDDEAGVDLFGGSAAKRVEAWAAAHGIRQFQALGQPPVTVWRELRRIDEQRAAGGTDALRKAHQAATRGTIRRADWRAYLDAQGGAMVGRRYAVRLLTEDRESVGRYGVAVTPLVLGVVDASRPDEWVLSNRREWKPRGAWDAPAAARVAEATAPAFGPLLDWRPHRASAPQARPWTRVNNCTAPTMLAGRLLEAGELLRAWNSIEPGGSPPEETSP